ncbi:MAG TPA: NAD-dependent epimerase/dehydratase family protein, partial [Myxococcota bacterium]|nr:NAD-dependent epimerase/dehydratase family protein [Myxococcota bacterium]
MATILLTGAAGFIGWHVARRLGADGHRVVGVDHLGPLFFPSLKRARVDALAGTPGFSFVVTDLAEPGAADALVASLRPDAIVHLAAQTGVRHSADDPHLYVRNNVDAFVAVLEAARRRDVPRLLYASSSAVYGEGEGRRVEDDRADRPVSLYAATKRADELMAHTYARQFGLTTVGMRFFT